MKMLDLLGEEWYELLLPFIRSPEFIKLKDSINESSKSNKIIPSRGSGLTFRAFKDCQVSDIKVVILGQEPYNTMVNRDDSVYDGYAFSNGNSLKPEPVLENIINEIERSYPDNINLDRLDLSYLAYQGVLLVNTTLSTIRYKSGSHNEIWRNFTNFWISRLSEKRGDLIWLLMGNYVKGYKHLIKNGHIIETGHPNPFNKIKPFVGSNCFIESNNILKKLNYEQIIW